MGCQRTQRTTEVCNAALKFFAVQLTQHIFYFQCRIAVRLIKLLASNLQPVLIIQKGIANLSGQRNRRSGTNCHDIVMYSVRFLIKGIRHKNLLSCIAYGSRVGKIMRCNSQRLLCGVKSRNTRIKTCHQITHVLISILYKKKYNRPRKQNRRWLSHPCACYCFASNIPC